jgi:hypothetical protein
MFRRESAVNTVVCKVVYSPNLSLAFWKRGRLGLVTVAKIAIPLIMPLLRGFECNGLLTTPSFLRIAAICEQLTPLPRIVNRLALRSRDSYDVMLENLQIPGGRFNVPAVSNRCCCYLCN